MNSQSENLVDIPGQEHYLNLLSQPRVKVVRALKKIQRKDSCELPILETNKPSKCNNRLQLVKQFGIDWEGRDITYYYLEQQLKEQNNKELPVKEFEKKFTFK